MGLPAVPESFCFRLSVVSRNVGATYHALCTKIGHQSLRMVVDSVFRRHSSFEGGEAGIISPGEHASVSYVPGEKVFIAQPADTAVF